VGGGGGGVGMGVQNVLLAKASSENPFGNFTLLLQPFSVFPLLPLKQASHCFRLILALTLQLLATSYQFLSQELHKFSASVIIVLLQALRSNMLSNFCTHLLHVPANGFGGATLRVHFFAIARAHKVAFGAGVGAGVGGVGARHAAVQSPAEGNCPPESGAH
jgi:hypothetical protein